MNRLRTGNSHLLLVAILGVLVLLPSRAAAHLVTTGMGPVYDGIGHLLLTPEDLVPVLAVALYAGLRGTAAGRYALFGLPLFWFAGGLAGLAATDGTLYPLPALSFLVLGLLIAFDLRLPVWLFMLLIALLGLVHGFFNGVALRHGPGSLGLLGIMAALFVAIALVSGVVVSLRPPWTRIAVRVAGSWVAAMGLLMVGWQVSGQG